MNQNMDEYIKNYIETRNYIPFFREKNGDCLYLKDYSKVVRGIPGSISIIPEAFEDENITLIVTPTEEEKLILATNLSDFNPICLGAIINGRKMLETLSKEEAIKECDKINEKFLQDSLLSKDTYADDRDLNKMTRAYLDNTLYEKSLRALNEFAAASIKVEQMTETKATNQQLDTTKTEKEIVVSTPENTIEEVNQLAEEKKTIETPSETATFVEQPKEEAPKTTVPLPKDPIEIPSFEPPTETLPASANMSTDYNGNIEAYNKMVAEVVNGNRTEPVVPTIPDIAELLQPQAVSTVPNNPAANQEIPVPISTPISLEAMAPSFDGGIGGRAM